MSKEEKAAKELRVAAQEALEKTNVEHEQAFYAKFVAFLDEVVPPATAPAPATNDNTPSSQS